MMTPARANRLLMLPGLLWLVGLMIVPCLLIFGLMGIRLFLKLVECPRGILAPLIVILCVVGTYAIPANK